MARMSRRLAPTNSIPTYVTKTMIYDQSLFGSTTALTPMAEHPDNAYFDLVLNSTTSSPPQITHNGTQFPIPTPGNHRYRGWAMESMRYQRYRVLKVVYEIKVIRRDNSTGSQEPLRITLVPASRSSPFAPQDIPQELPGALPAQFISGDRTATFRYTHFPHKHLGLSFKDYLANPSTAAGVNSFPSLQFGAYLHVFGTAPGTAQSIPFVMSVRAIATIRFFDRLTSLPSNAISLAADVTIDDADAAESHTLEFAGHPQLPYI